MGVGCDVKFRVRSIFEVTVGSVKMYCKLHMLYKYIFDCCPSVDGYLLLYRFTVAQITRYRFHTAQVTDFTLRRLRTDFLAFPQVFTV
jgi:tRNA(Ile)-lysidine synthase TilS/MesJ